MVTVMFAFFYEISFLRGNGNNQSVKKKKRLKNYRKKKINASCPLQNAFLHVKSVSLFLIVCLFLLLLNLFSAAYGVELDC